MEVLLVESPMKNSVVSLESSTWAAIPIVDGGHCTVSLQLQLSIHADDDLSCACLLQSTAVTEAPVTSTVMVDQDPPIDPSAETAPPGEPALPVSSMTGQVTSTPQLGPANPGVTQEITPVSFLILGLSQCILLPDCLHSLLRQVLAHLLNMLVLFLCCMSSRCGPHVEPPDLKQL